MPDFILLKTANPMIMVLGDSHVAGKKYWIISQVVEVITSDIIQYFLPATW